MDIVRKVLETQQKELATYKPIEVEKRLDCNIDIGHLLLKDPNDLDEQEMK